MKLLIGLFLVTVALGLQDFGYGKPEEMKGLKKVFVNTGADVTNRERIIKEIQNAKLDIEILRFRRGSRDYTCVYRW